MSWNILAIVQDAQTNTLNIEILVKAAIESTNDSYWWYWSNNYTDDLSLRPKLVIEYTLPVVYGSATFSGTGTLSASAKVTYTGKATFSGQGAIAALGRLLITAKATASGTGALTAAAHVTRTATATMAGTGTLTAAGTVLGAAIYGSATFSGTGTLTAKAGVLRPGTAAFTGTGSLAAQGVVTRLASATFAGTGTLSAAAGCIRLAVAVFQGTGSLSAIGSITGLTATLLAAQKKAARLPYVEARIYDYEQGIKRLSWERLYDGSTPWLTPTGHNDPEDAWTDEEKAYDDTDSTHATKQGLVTGQWTPFLELTHEALLCNKVRFLLNNSDFDLVDVDVYYDSAWHDVYQGVYDAYPTWNEKNIPDGPKTITKARLRARATITAPDHGCWFHELDFGVPAGLEPDNHHGVAFDGQGSMHRIRAGSTSSLYYQKVENPDESSDYSQWTEIATDCAGPCAIAAQGARVYIFYRTSTNVLWKYYSHNYGDSWTNAQLVAYADVLSMAACWWGTGNIVACLALKSNQVNGIVLDTSDQSTSQHTKNFYGAAVHVFLDTYGIGATFNSFWPAIEIILAAKEYDDDTDTVTYSLYATWLSDTYNFLEPRVLLTAYEDVLTIFKHPDCHLPAQVLTQEGEPYETLQLTVVEDFAGVTAYSRPLSARLVKGTDWSSGTITEPRPFVDLSALYGLRLQSTGDYWWLSRPDGVWRAPRPASPPIVLTSADDILSLTQSVGNVVRGFSLVLELDNSQGQYVPIPSGLHFRSEVVLKLGYKTTAGNQAVESLTYWVDGWQYSTTHQTQSTLKLFCLDLWGLAAAWSARYSLRWNYTEVQPCRVWEILYQLLGRFGIRLWNNPAAPKSSTIDDYYPKFLSRGGTHGDTQLRRLLSFVTDALVPRGDLCFVKDLLADEDSCYSYSSNPSNPSNSHPILSGSYAEATPVTHAQVSGDTQDEPPVRVRESAFDWDLLALGIDNLRMQYDANLEEADQAQKRADALLRTQGTQGTQATLIVVPTNVAQELYDVVEVTDARCGISQEKYRVLAIRTDYDRRQGRYEQKLSLGAP